jgi:hypothetical protein
MDKKGEQIIFGDNPNPFLEFFTTLSSSLFSSWMLHKILEDATFSGTLHSLLEHVLLL